MLKDQWEALVLVSEHLEDLVVMQQEDLEKGQQLKFPAQREPTAHMVTNVDIIIHQVNYLQLTQETSLHNFNKIRQMLQFLAQLLV